MQDEKYRTLSTDELETELRRSPSLHSFLSEQEECFKDTAFTDLLTHALDKSGMSKAALARESYTSEVYLHQIFSGRRRPSRNRLLCLCIGLRISLEDCQELLRRNRNAMLYARYRRDAVIAYGITHGMDLYEINDKLFQENEETLI